MPSKFEVTEIAKVLSGEWGPEAVNVDDEENKVYIQFIDDVVASLTIDCDLGVSHCVADLANVFPPALAPKDFEDLCVYANRLNITLSRNLGVTQHFQVLDDTLKLTDTCSFAGSVDIVETCNTQARSVMSLMQVVTQSLLQDSNAPADVERDVPQNAMFI